VVETINVVWKSSEYTQMLHQSSCVIHEYADDNVKVPHKTCLPLAIKTRLSDNILVAYYNSVTAAGSTSAVVGVYWSRGKYLIFFFNSLMY
jgi:hypothetical protein